MIISASTRLRLAWHEYRFGFAIVVLVGVVLSLAAVFATFQLESFGVDQACIDDWLIGENGISGCADRMTGWVAFNDAVAGPLLGIATVLAFGLGLLVGVPIVADEIEGGSAEFSWAFSSSRAHWLWERTWPAAIILIAFVVPIAIGTALLSATRSGGWLWVSAIAEIDRQGLGIIARAVFAFALGATLGAVTGRPLGAFVLGVTGCALVSVALDVVRTNLVASTALLIDANPGMPGWARIALESSDSVDIRVPIDGRLVPVADAALTAPAGLGDVAAWLEMNFHGYPFGIPAALAFRWQAVESVVLVVAAAALLGLLNAVVRNRRP